MSKEIVLSLSVKTIIFGVFDENKNVDFVLNSLLLFGKFFIHKCRYYKTKPTLTHWRNELNLLSKSLKLVEEEKALKLFSLLETFKLI